MSRIKTMLVQWGEGAIRMGWDKLIVGQLADAVWEKSHAKFFNIPARSEKYSYTHNLVFNLYKNGFEEEAAFLYPLLLQDIKEIAPYSINKVVMLAYELHWKKGKEIASAYVSKKTKWFIEILEVAVPLVFQFLKAAILAGVVMACYTLVVSLLH